MSATIFYEPVNPEPSEISCAAPSSFQEMMGRAGMGLPCELSATNIPTLRGMAAAAPRSGFCELINAITEHDRIRLWASY